MLQQLHTHSSLSPRWSCPDPQPIIKSRLLTHKRIMTSAILELNLRCSTILHPSQPHTFFLMQIYDMQYLS